MLRYMSLALLLCAALVVHVDDVDGQTTTPSMYSIDLSQPVAPPLIGLIDKHDRAEQQVTGRYVLPDGTVSRDPLGGPELKCTGADTVFHPNGPAVAVDIPHQGIVHPTVWMSLSGRPQAAADRNTRGYFTPGGKRVWLDVFPAVTVP